MLILDCNLEGSSIIIQIDGNEPLEKAIEKFFLKTGCPNSYKELTSFQ